MVISIFLSACFLCQAGRKESNDPADSLKGKWKVTELAEIGRTGTTYWAEETYLGRSIEISGKRIEKSIDQWPGHLYIKSDEYEFCRSEQIPAERLWAREDLLNLKGWIEFHKNEVAKYISFYKSKHDLDENLAFDKYVIFQDGSVYTEFVDGWYKIEPYVQACTDINVEDLFGKWVVRRLVSYEDGWIGERSLLEFNREYINSIIPELGNWEEAEGIDFQVKEYYGDVLQIEQDKICLQSEGRVKDEHDIMQFETYTCNTQNYQSVKGIHDELGIISDEIQVITGQFAEKSERSLLDGDIVVIDNKNIIVKIENGWYLLSRAASNVSDDITCLYHLEETGDTYGLTVNDRRGNVIFDERYGAEPIIGTISDDTLLIICGKGDWHVYTFVNVDMGLVSEEFNDVSAWNSKMVVYAVFRDGTYQIIVQGIYDKNNYYMEIERNFSAMAVPHYIIKEAVFLDDSTLKLKYLCGKDMEIKEEIIRL